MAKQTAKCCNSARLLIFFALLTTAIFVVHVSNNATIFDAQKQVKESLNMLRKNNGHVKSLVSHDVVHKPEDHTLRSHLTTQSTKNLKLEVMEHNSGSQVHGTVVEKDREDISQTGFINHPILYLTDIQFSKTPLDQLMKAYGEADGGGSCANDFGNGLVNRWRDKKTSYCDQNDLMQDNKLNTHIDCHHVTQTRHHGTGDQLCVMNNVMVNLSLFNDEHITSSVVKEYVKTHHAKQPYVKFPQDFIQGDCTPKPELWTPATQPGWNADLTVTGYTTNRALTADECDVWIDHPVLIQQRDTFANFFHDSEDFVNVFLALSILQWSRDDVQLMLTDLYPEGPFWGIWKRVYSSKHPAMTAWDIKQKYRHIGNGAATGVKADGTHTKNKVCFKQLAIGIYGPASPITVASWDTPCSKTALVRAYSDFVIRGLGLQDKTHYASERPSNTIVITYMARRPSKEWPEKKYCSSTDSFFDCKLWESFGQRSLGRMIRNDKAVSEALKSLETIVDWSTEGRNVVFQDVDYNVLSFQEQIEIDLQTDIMIGPHGAGLMHNIFMRDRATLVELSIDGSGVNRHFHNLARWQGRRYRGLSASNPVDTEKLVQSMIAEIRAIDIKKY